MPDEPPLGHEIDSMLKRMTPENLDYAMEAVRTYRVNLEHLLAAARRAEGERMHREIEYNVLCGVPQADAPKVAKNELAFFRAELAKELHEAVDREKEALRRKLRRLLEDQEAE